MEQEFLFYESAEEAARHAIVASGKAMKEVAHGLWPHLKIDTAHARLRNALNDDKPDKLTMDEIIHIARLTERVDPLFYMAEALNYERPKPRAPIDELGELYAKYIAATKQLEQIAQRIQRTQLKAEG